MPGVLLGALLPVLARAGLDRDRWPVVSAPMARGDLRAWRLVPRPGGMALAWRTLAVCK